MDVPDLALLALLAALSFALAFHGAAAGLQLGQLRQPLLLYFLPTAAAAAAANLTVSGMGALAGAAAHARGGRIVWPFFWLLALPSVAGGILGAWLLARAEPTYAKLVIGGFLLFSAANMLLSPPEEDQADTPAAPRLFVEVLVGLALGFLAAITGLMMGSLRLPRMIKQLGMDPKLAVGTNMAVGCATALTSALALWMQDGTPILAPVLWLAGPTILGGWLGASWTGTMDKAALTRMVGWTVAAAGVLMLGDVLLRPLAMGLIAPPAP